MLFLFILESWIWALSAVEGFAQTDNEMLKDLSIPEFKIIMKELIGQGWTDRHSKVYSFWIEDIILNSETTKTPIRNVMKGSVFPL